MLQLDTMKIHAKAVAKTATKLSTKAYQAGKLKAEMLAIESKIARAERQLGAVVYELHATNEQNDVLCERYFDLIAQLKTQVKALQAQAETLGESPEIKPQQTKIFCKQCGVSLDQNMVFCPDCGATVS